ncbi:MAG: carboxypeptidase-like regulatory domain-containing protein [bacterium]
MRVPLMAAALALAMVSTCGSAWSAIVNNSTTGVSPEDSLAQPFVSLDSLGNPTTADSVYLVISGPSGAVVFRDSMAASDSRVVSTQVRGKQFYHFRAQVSNLDGSGDPGGYGLLLLAKNNTLDLLTPTVGGFQIISRELSDQLELIEDSVRVRGGWIDTNLTQAASTDSTQLARWVWNTPQSGHTTVGTFGKYLDTEVSGVGGSGDSSQIARWVWNTPQANHVLSGSFGDYLDAEISGLSAGSGSYAITLYAFDSSIAQVIPGVALAVRNLDQSALLASVYTDVSGRAVVNLDAGDYVVIARAPGYAFEGADTLVIAAAAVDTALGYQFDPGVPSIAGQCRVWGYLFDASGRPEDEVTVTASLPSGTTTHGNQIIVPTVLTTNSDTAGYFYLDLLPSDSLGEVGTLYEFTIYRSNGMVLRQRLTVPDSTSWRLTW